MVVRQRHWPYTERLVLVDPIASTTEEEIRLSCSLAEVHNLENFVETEFLKPPEDRTVPSVPLDSPPIYLWPYALPVSEINGISEDRLQLRLDRRAVEALPHGPYHAISLLPGVQRVDRELLPQFPPQGVPNVAPDMAHLEAAHVLAQEARVRLEARGFTSPQILNWAKDYWAKDYLGAERSGGGDEFISWIGRKEYAS